MNSESFIRISTAIVRERCEFWNDNPVIDWIGRKVENPSIKVFIKMCDLAEQSGEDTMYLTKSDVELLFL